MKKMWCAWFASVLLMVVAASVVIADQFNRSIEVLDGNGVLRAVVFAADNNGKSGLELKDANGNVKLSIHMNQRHDAFVNILDANGRNRIELGISPNGDAYLVLRKGDGTVVHSLVAPN